MIDEDSYGTERRPARERATADGGSPAGDRPNPEREALGIGALLGQGLGRVTDAASVPTGPAQDPAGMSASHGAESR